MAKAKGEDFSTFRERGRSVRGDDPPAEKAMSKRRVMPVDLGIGEKRLSPRDNHDAADADYKRSLGMPARRNTEQSLPPTRDARGEPGARHAIERHEHKPAYDRKRMVRGGE